MPQLHNNLPEVYFDSFFGDIKLLYLLNLQQGAFNVSLVGSESTKDVILILINLNKSVPVTVGFQEKTYIMTPQTFFLTSIKPLQIAVPEQFVGVLPILALPKHFFDGLQEPSKEFVEPYHDTFNPYLHLFVTQLTDKKQQKFIKHKALFNLLYGVSEIIFGSKPQENALHEITLVTEYLLEKIHEPLPRLSQLCLLANQSSSTLKRNFKEINGCSIKTFFYEKKIEQAHLYLKQGLSVKEVAHKLGYKQATNFTTAFKKKYGINPSEISKK